MEEEKKRFSTQPLRGMVDSYPSDLRLDNWIIDQIGDIIELYCYEEYSGPLLEPIEIFAAKSSDELVQEQAYWIKDKKNKKLIVRPEITPTLARMIAKRSQEFKKPIRWYSVPTCYRYEAPQRGRRREFIQFNVDILGENSLYAELEIFNIIVDILTSFGATSEQFQIYFNNRRFIDAICTFILKVSKEKIPLIYNLLDKSGKMEESEFLEAINENFQEEYIIQGILKLKDTKNLEELLKSFENIPEQFFNSQGYKELSNIEKSIQVLDISKYCSFSSSVVRGLDYYTGTVFEVFDTGKENRRAIFGGGRYDNLLSLFSNEELSGIGFGMGLLMLKLFLETYDLIPEDIMKSDFSDVIFIASVNKKVSHYAHEIAQNLRNEDFPCIIDYRFENLGNQLRKASEIGVRISLILGPKEMEQNKITIKNMVSEQQKTIDAEDLINEIFSIFDKLEEVE
ncbi:MAG: histidine--tRNA ligase [Candidatus Lokiarchaeota archaeon]|nr:histidine--tRNA ligase [Candidatus Lokiarchaeota archaeon]